MLIFVTCINQRSGYEGCVAVSVLYFILVAVMWMEVEVVLAHVQEAGHRVRSNHHKIHCCCLTCLLGVAK